MNGPRLMLKQPAGWFAAGREVAQAMTLLSDGAFKLYLHLCLQANRHTARVVLNPTEWMHLLEKDPAWIEACLAELYRNRICDRDGGSVEVCDRFWPYQKLAGVAARHRRWSSSGRYDQPFCSPHACARRLRPRTKSWR